MLVGISSAIVNSRSFESRYNDDDCCGKIHPSDRVQAMSKEDGHKLDLETGGRRPSFRKYAADAENESPYRGGGNNEDRVSVLSSSSFRQRGSVSGCSDSGPKLPWYKGVTCHDIRAIMPTVLILLGGLLIMIFVIPYAFSTVIKQLQAEEALEHQRRLAEEAAAVNTTISPPLHTSPITSAQPPNLHLSSTLPSGVVES